MINPSNMPFAYDVKNEKIISFTKEFRKKIFEEMLKYKYAITLEDFVYLKNTQDKRRIRYEAFGEGGDFLPKDVVDILNIRIEDDVIYYEEYTDNILNRNAWDYHDILICCGYNVNTDENNDIWYVTKEQVDEGGDKALFTGNLELKQKHKTVGDRVGIPII